MRNGLRRGSMSNEAVMNSCCCPTTPCPCRLETTSVVVKWSGSVTFRPLSCIQFHNAICPDNNICTVNHSLAFDKQTTFAYPQTPIAFGQFCGSAYCYSSNHMVDRFFRCFEPTDRSPASLCSYEVKEAIQYGVKINHAVVVNLPTFSALTGITTPWRIVIYIGMTELFFDAQGDAGCDPAQLIFQLNKQRSKIYKPNTAVSPCSGLHGVNCSNLPGESDTCSFINPPSIWPCTGTSGGDLLRHQAIVDIGSVKLS